MATAAGGCIFSQRRARGPTSRKGRSWGEHREVAHVQEAVVAQGCPGWGMHRSPPGE